jgi:hypothetical protein
MNERAQESPAPVNIEKAAKGNAVEAQPVDLEDGSPPSENGGPPDAFGSLRREILIVSVCTWAPAAMVIPHLRLTDASGNEFWYCVGCTSDNSVGFENVTG